VHQLAGRSLFVFPLLHPAAALRTPKLVETLQQDFARLRALLDEPLPAAASPSQPQSAEPAQPPPPADRESQLDLFA
jgi:DNA polymerase